MTDKPTTGELARAAQDACEHCDVPCPACPISLVARLAEVEAERGKLFLRVQNYRLGGQFTGDDIDKLIAERDDLQRRLDSAPPLELVLADVDMGCADSYEHWLKEHGPGRDGEADEKP